jgi:hypothetical protein
MEEQPDEAVATAFSRAIQALEKMLTTLRRTARTAAGLRETAVARRLDELAGDVEQSLQGLRSRAAARRRSGSGSRSGSNSNSSARRNGQ